MEERRVNAQRLSGRQLAVASMVSGLSPAAALAGTASWPRLALWCGVGLLMAWVALRAVSGQAVFRGRRGQLLSLLYKVWAVVLAAETLGRTVRRLEFTSGGSSGFWLLVLLAIPLLRFGWGRAAPFFRMTEILWLAMLVALAAVAVFGLARVEWQYVCVPGEDWKGSAWAACEVLSPFLFVLPYINQAQEHTAGQALSWLAALSGVAVLLCLIVCGLLGRASGQVPQAFFVAGGLLGKSSRCEGLLSVLWLLPDLTLVGLLCRVWGARRWPALGAALALAAVLLGVAEKVPAAVCGAGTVFLWALTVLPAGRNGKNCG